MDHTHTHTQINDTHIHMQEGSEIERYNNGEKKREREEIHDREMEKGRDNGGEREKDDGDKLEIPLLQSEGGENIATCGGRLQIPPSESLQLPETSVLQKSDSLKSSDSSLLQGSESMMLQSSESSKNSEALQSSDSLSLQNSESLKYQNSESLQSSESILKHSEALLSSESTLQNSKSLQQSAMSVLQGSEAFQQSVVSQQELMLPQPTPESEHCSSHHFLPTVLQDSHTQACWQECNTPLLQPAMGGLDAGSALLDQESAMLQSQSSKYITNLSSIASESAEQTQSSPQNVEKLSCLASKTQEQSQNIACLSCIGSESLVQSQNSKNVASESQERTRNVENLSYIANEKCVSLQTGENELLESVQVDCSATFVSPGALELHGIGSGALQLHGDGLGTLQMHSGDMGALQSPDLAILDSKNVSEISKNDQNSKNVSEVPNNGQNSNVSVSEIPKTVHNSETVSEISKSEHNSNVLVLECGKSHSVEFLSDKNHISSEDVLEKSNFSKKFSEGESSQSLIATELSSQNLNETELSNQSLNLTENVSNQTLISLDIDSNINITESSLSMIDSDVIMTPLDSHLTTECVGVRTGQKGDENSGQNTTEEDVNMLNKENMTEMNNTNDSVAHFDKGNDTVDSQVSLSESETNIHEFTSSNNIRTSLNEPESSVQGLTNPTDAHMGQCRSVECTHSHADAFTPSTEAETEPEPLKPVTIGSSLQPLEELQEASLFHESSFTPNLNAVEGGTIDGSIIGGGVIDSRLIEGGVVQSGMEGLTVNSSVVGGTENVIVNTTTFPPHNDMDVDQELTEISSSAPELTDISLSRPELMDIFGDDGEPCRKRMRYDDASGAYKLTDCLHRVVLRMSPVENGHGVWDAYKLRDILATKGTILIRLHASKASLEVFEVEREKGQRDEEKTMRGGEKVETGEKIERDREKVEAEEKIKRDSEKGETLVSMFAEKTERDGEKEGKRENEKNNETENREENGNNEQKTQNRTIEMEPKLTETENYQQKTDTRITETGDSQQETEIEPKSMENSNSQQKTTGIGKQEQKIEGNSIENRDLSTENENNQQKATENENIQQKPTENENIQQKSSENGNVKQKTEPEITETGNSQKKLAENWNQEQKPTENWNIQTKSSENKNIQQKMTETEVDFSAILIETHDDDDDGPKHNHPKIFDPPSMGLVSAGSVGDPGPHTHAGPGSYGAITTPIAGRLLHHHQSAVIARGRSSSLSQSGPTTTRPYFKHLHSHVYSMKSDLYPSSIDYDDTYDWSGNNTTGSTTTTTTTNNNKEYYGGLLLSSPPPATPQYYGHPGVPPAMPLPPRGRKRGRPPLNHRKGFPVSLPRIGTCKVRPLGCKQTDVIKYRPPTPPPLFLSSLLKLSKSSIGLLGKNDAKKGSQKSIGLDALGLKRDSTVSGDGSHRKGSDTKDESKRDSGTSVQTISGSKRKDSGSNMSGHSDKSSKRYLIKLPCDFCNLVFRKRSSLHAHIKQKHRGMQSCPICNEKVKVKGKYGMRFHILKNHKDQPHFHCNKCNESFKLQHHLTNHQRMAHEYDNDNSDDSDDSDTGGGDCEDVVIEEQHNEKREREIEGGNKEREKEKEMQEMNKANKNNDDKSNIIPLKRELHDKEKINYENISLPSKIPRQTNTNMHKHAMGKVPAISRGKIMNVRPPPAKAQAPRSMGPKGAKSAENGGVRVTRSTPKVGNKNFDSDNDDVQKNECKNDIRASSSSSSSSSESSLSTDSESESERKCEEERERERLKIVNRESVREKEKESVREKILNIGSGKIYNKDRESEKFDDKDREKASKREKDRKREKINDKDREKGTKESESKKVNNKDRERDKIDDKDREKDSKREKDKEKIDKDREREKTDDKDRKKENNDKDKEKVNDREREKEKNDRERKKINNEDRGREKIDSRETETESESEEDEEEEELRRERERKERERQAKEVALTCKVCAKICRSEYQLKLHMPSHTKVPKKPSSSGARKSIAQQKANVDKSCTDERARESIRDRDSADTAPRVLRSKGREIERVSEKESERENVGGGKNTQARTHSDIKQNTNTNKKEFFMTESEKERERDKDREKRAHTLMNTQRDRDKDTNSSKDSNSKGAGSNKDSNSKGAGSNKDSNSKGAGSNKDSNNKGTNSNRDSSNKGANSSKDSNSKGANSSKDGNNKGANNSNSKGDLNERPSYILKVGSLFRCTKCNVTFNREKSMTYHLKKIHETLYPFRGCQHCGKIFRSCGPYNRHVLSHKVHHCPEANCKAKYRKMLRLKQHQKNAHANKPHRCAKCVLIFAKKCDLEKHREVQHPKVPTDSEDDDLDEIDESDDDNNDNNTKDSNDKPQDDDKDDKKDSGEPQSPVEEDVVSSGSPKRRRARCVPISYKEPDDDEDDILFKKGLDRRKFLHKLHRLSAKERKMFAARPASISLGLGCTNVNEKLSKVNSLIDIDVSSKTCVLKKLEKCFKGNVGDKTCQTEQNVSEMEHKRTTTNKIQTHTHAQMGGKKNKVNLSWTAALKAQLHASKHVNKPTQMTMMTDKKCNKNNMNRGKQKQPTHTQTHTHKQTHIDTNIFAPTSTNTNIGIHSNAGSTISTISSTTTGATIGLSADTLNYPSCLSAEDSLFSLDDSSQMDIMGDYYGSHYPPSEEISDFVPEDDDDSPAKIIGFDSF